MTEKLLSYAAVILLFASFTFASSGTTSSATLSTALALARILPIGIVVLICLASVPIRDYGVLAKSLATPPFVFWIWYAIVAFTSGFLSDISPAWCAWKSIEVFVVITWGAALALHARRVGNGVVLERAFKALVFGGIVISCWSLAEVLRRGESLAQFVFSEKRLETEWPGVNSINLSILSMLALCGIVVMEGRSRLLRRWLLLVPLIGVFLLSRSRTGLLGSLTVIGVSMLSSNVSKGRRAAFVLLGICMFAVFASSSSIREWMRIDSWQEISKGAGRIVSESGRSAWGETLEKIQDRPAIGYGFVNVQRMMDRNHLAVDNFALQSLISAGIIGAGPMILYAFYAFARWLFPMTFPDPQFRKVAAMGLICTCMGFAKSLTTNGVAMYDSSLILFILGAVVFQWVSENRPRTA